VACEQLTSNRIATEYAENNPSYEFYRISLISRKHSYFMEGGQFHGTCRGREMMNHVAASVVVLPVV